jgi:hypothetical protein
MADLESVIGTLTPIAKLRHEEINKLRGWAATHSVKRASTMRREASHKGRTIEIKRPSRPAVA